MQTYVPAARGRSSSPTPAPRHRVGTGGQRSVDQHGHAFPLQVEDGQADGRGRVAGQLETDQGPGVEGVGVRRRQRQQRGRGRDRGRRPGVGQAVAVVVDGEGPDGVDRRQRRGRVAGRRVAPEHAAGLGVPAQRRHHRERGAGGHLPGAQPEQGVPGDGDLAAAEVAVQVLGIERRLDLAGEVGGRRRREDPPEGVAVPDRLVLVAAVLEVGAEARRREERAALPDVDRREVGLARGAAGVGVQVQQPGVAVDPAVDGQVEVGVVPAGVQAVDLVAGGPSGVRGVGQGQVAVPLARLEAPVEGHERRRAQRDRDVVGRGHGRVAGAAGVAHGVGRHEQAQVGGVQGRQRRAVGGVQLQGERVTGEGLDHRGRVAQDQFGRAVGVLVDAEARRVQRGRRRRLVEGHDQPARGRVEVGRHGPRPEVVGQRVGQRAQFGDLAAGAGRARHAGEQPHREGPGALDLVALHERAGELALVRRAGGAQHPGRGQAGPGIALAHVGGVGDPDAVHLRVPHQVDQRGREAAADPVGARAHAVDGLQEAVALGQGDLLGHLPARRAQRHGRAGALDDLQVVGLVLVVRAHVAEGADVVGDRCSPLRRSRRRCRCRWPCRRRPAP